MNAWQVAKQLRSLLQEATWPDGGSVVFGKVLISAGIDLGAEAQLRFPFARIWPLDMRPDPDEINLVSQRFAVQIVANVPGDCWGETVLVGGARGGGQGGSSGRGLMELEEVFFDAVSSLNETDGVRIRLSASGAAAAANSQDHGYVASRDYELQAWCSADRSYPPASRVSATDQGSQVARLAWTLPGERYDRVSVVVRRASGSTAPASVTDGTGVTVSGVPSTVDDSVGSAGTYSWAVFVGYDELGTGSADRYSPAAVVEGVAIA